ncbi:hypothetical protein A3J43_01580 [Candidatus Uhrbacteria bacterium RIFCSPHIGHO2_12_FULL_54_23]|uniref:Hydrolase n=2 Tax=Candidatus Uhriibacteriota TaxID=1752732 RepID=A0A1F7UNH0_9BACT|nr:MAG: hypothetical protein A3J43_01580 [Candidatus Uhrbacteria bacterium RIFCSPHIGHO2_12_FULL_54_23]OGL90664.1 MAG: hypothetical protein A3J36_03480 [Candidatus Uhrbacteria bacterium RIFCSPLOWO2_02_FULL_54_37]
MDSRKRELAIFDLDGTIFMSSLTIELLEALIEEDVFPARDERIHLTYSAGSIYYKSLCSI